MFNALLALRNSISNVTAEMEGVVSVFPNLVLNLQTTRSWNFMDFSHDHLPPSQEGDVIVALLDTGI